MYSCENLTMFSFQNRGLRKSMDRLKLDMTIVGYQLNGLEVRHSCVRLKGLGSSPECAVVDEHY